MRQRITYSEAIFHFRNNWTGGEADRPSIAYTLSKAFDRDMKDVLYALRTGDVVTRS